MQPVAGTRLILGTSAVVIATWTTAALVMSGRGLDVTDEGFYLLSYRWWQTNSANFTGVQYIWGPIYSLLGHDVQGLRVVRLLSLLVVHLALGIAVANWARALSGRTLPTSARRAIVCSVVASGGIAQAWGPLSPGYNDVGLLAALAMAAGAIAVQVGVLEGKALPIGVAAGVGPVVVALVLAKWTTALVAVPFVLACVALSIRGRPRGLLPWVGVALASLGMTTLFVELALSPWSEIVDGILPVTESISSGTNSPSALIPLYLRSLMSVAGLAAFPILLSVGVVALLRKFTSRLAGPMSIAAPGMAATLVAFMAGGLEGGVRGVIWYSAALVATLGTTLLITRRADTQSALRPHLALVVMLLLLPGVQALGTGNALYYLAVNGIATCVGHVNTFSARQQRNRGWTCRSSGDRRLGRDVWPHPTPV
jgi:hypothetical protein